MKFFKIFIFFSSKSFFAKLSPRKISLPVILKLASCNRFRRISFNLFEIFHKPVTACPFRNDKKGKIQNTQKQKEETRNPEKKISRFFYFTKKFSRYAAKLKSVRPPRRLRNFAQSFYLCTLPEAFPFAKASTSLTETIL